MATKKKATVEKTTKAKTTKKKAPAKKTPAKKRPPGKYPLKKPTITKNGKTMGRPLTQIDWYLVDKLCEIHCTHEEIAGTIGIHYNVLNQAAKRDHGITFSEYSKQKRGLGKKSLRRRLYLEATEKRNTAVMIFLAKNWLGMTDKTQVEQKTSGVEKVVLSFPDNPMDRVQTVQEKTDESDND